jgi:hypothetical protein
MADLPLTPPSSKGHLSSRVHLTSLKPKDIDTGLLQQLATNRTAMYRLAIGLPEGQVAMVRSAIDAALFCHYGHTRIGTPPIHYSHHLLEVMRRVNHLARVGSSESSLDSESLAVKLSVATLHDSMEDIASTFPQLTNRLQGFSIVEEYIRSRLITVVDPPTVDSICEAIRTLSIGNDEDFSDSSYVATISESPICKPIKWADINHNMLTMPDVSPLAGAVSYPAQYATLMKGSPYYDEFIHQVLLCAERTQDTLRPQEFTESRLGRALGKLHRFEGTAGLLRLHSFYQGLMERLQIEPEAPAFPKRYSSEKLAKVLHSHLGAIVAAREFLQ